MLPQKQSARIIGLFLTSLALASLGLTTGSINLCGLLVAGFDSRPQWEREQRSPLACQ